MQRRDPRPGVANWNRKHNACRNVLEFASREVFDNAPLSWQVYDPRLQDFETQAAIDSARRREQRPPRLQIGTRMRVAVRTWHTVSSGFFWFSSRLVV